MTGANVFGRRQLRMRRQALLAFGLVLGAAADAIKAALAAAPTGEADNAGRRECQWQRDRLPAAIRGLVLDDQRLRDSL